jgi:hypothetical protein
MAVTGHLETSSPMLNQVWTMYLSDGDTRVLETQYPRPRSGSADARFELSVTVPPNARATVRRPGAPLADVSEGGRPIATAAVVAGARQDGSAAVVEVGSGTCTFSYPAANLELPPPSLPATSP